MKSLSERTRGGSIAPSNDPEVPAVKVDITATCKAWSWRSVAADLLGAPHDERERQGDQTEVRGQECGVAERAFAVLNEAG